MHGIIFLELEKYVVTKFGDDTWSKLLQETGLKGKVYWIGQIYPDEEVVALVSIAAKITRSSVAAILEDFGEFIAPNLVKIYMAFIVPTWKTVDLLENAEETIHKVVRMKLPGADPAILKTSRPNQDEVIIIYDSPRKMCGVAKGIARGVAKYYGESITINEPKCMLLGSPSCEIRVRLQK